MNIPPYGGGQQQQAPVDSNPWDLLERGGKPSLKFGHRDEYNRFVPPQPGVYYTGWVRGDVTKSQVTNFDTKELEWWDAEKTKPKMQLVADLELDPAHHPRENAEDDGIRRVYFKGQMLTALQTEAQEKGITAGFGDGTRVTITLIELKPNKDPNKNPQNIFRVDVGPEYFPWTPPQQRAVQQVISGGAPQAPGGGFPPQATVPNYPQMPPAQPPVQVPQAVQQLPGTVQQVMPPVPPQIPQQAAPQPPVQQGFDFAAMAAAAQQQAAPQPPAQPAGITQEEVNAILQLARMGVPVDAAIIQFAESTGRGGDADFIAALTHAVGPVQQ